MLGQIIVLGGSIYYLTKKKTTAGWLMTIGSLLGILMELYQRFLFPSLIAKKNLDNIVVTDYYYVFYTLHILFYFLFSIGFVMLIMKIVKKDENDDELKSF